MSDSREKFEAWWVSDDVALESKSSAWAGWCAALSVAPAPVAAEPELKLPADGAYIITFDDAEREDEMFVAAGARDAALRRFEQISGSWNAHLFVKIKSNSRDERTPSASPPVQEGPKGVEAEAKFEELLQACMEAYAGKGGAEIESAIEAMRQHFKQCTAQSIPAAPCQCKPDETTGWTDDDIMVPRCNVCGLVVMRVIAERKAARVPAAIDEEGRKALDLGIRCMRAIHTWGCQDYQKAELASAIAALERLLKQGIC